MPRINPNQKVITINKTIKHSEENKYVHMVVSVMEEAAFNLNAGAFKLWCYCMKNQDKFEFGLSSNHVKNCFNMGKSQYDSAVEELISKGYLVKVGKNVYNFFDVRKHNNESSLQENNTTKKDSFVVGKHNNENFVDIKSNNETAVLKLNNENLVVGKHDNEEDSSHFVVGKQYNDVVLKPNNETLFSLQENNTRNIINNNIINNIIEDEEFEGSSIELAIPKHSNWFKARGGSMGMTATEDRDVWIYRGVYYRVDDSQSKYEGMF